MRAYERFLTDDNCWFQSRIARAPKEIAGILFLDRDGVIVEEVDYLHRVDDVKLIEGAEQIISEVASRGFRVAMVTNQAGIGRGYYGWQEFSDVNNYILDYLEQRGARVDCVVAAPHHPDGRQQYRHHNHKMRKPNTGMLESACRLLNGDILRSFIVGDNITDIMAGKNFGLRKAFLVLTGHGGNHQQQARELKSADFSIEIIDSLADLPLHSAIQQSRSA